MSDGPSTRNASRHLLFVVTEDWYFVSHRLSLARAALAAGYRVSVATRVRAHGAQIRAAGVDIIDVDFRRGGLNPLHDLRVLFDLIALYRRLEPDLVHHVALKPVVLGSFAARWIRNVAIVNALGGLGYVFASPSRKASSLRPLVTRCLKISLGGRKSRLIVQNDDDRRLLTQRRIVNASAIRLVPGVGVDLRQYSHTDPASPPLLVVLPARMLKDKGVLEFVAAARALRHAGIAARFALVGAPDPENPASVSRAEIDAWVREGIVEDWGWRDDMPEVFRSAHVICLPSYREGLPKVLLEAAAAGRAVVATDVPGCRDAVRHGVTGLLVPVRDEKSLAAAIRQLLVDEDQRNRFGANARMWAESEFAVERIIAQTLALYEELVAL